MKVYNRTEFMKLPPGTVYSDYRPYTVDSLSVKTTGPDDMTGDFCHQDIDALEIESASSNELFDKLGKQLADHSVSLPLVFDSSGRDGMFDPDALFAVLDGQDIAKIVEVLTRDWARWGR